MPVIAIQNSTWNNVGDAFYQMSLFNILSQALPNAELVDFDGPGENAFNPGKHARNMLDTRSNVVADHYIFSGPILNPKFIPRYGKLIQKILADGATYSLFSTHIWQNHDNRGLLDFLRAHPPLAIQTRDHPSFEVIGDLSDCALDGICFAFFVAELPHIATVAFDRPTLAVSYYRGPEPVLSAGAGRFPDTALTLTPRPARHWRITRHLEHRKPHARKVGDYAIVRPVHSFYPLPHLIFNRPGSYLSYNPRNVLALYKGVDAVVTDRVHSAVAGLAFDKPAMVAAVDGRYALFDKLNLDTKNGFFLPNPKAIERERQRLMAWLTGPFADKIGL
jgi:hypothetical protein